MCDISYIYYNEKDNLFTDDFGFVIPNIYKVVDPNLIYLLKTKKEDMYVYGILGEYIHLVYEHQIEYIYSENNQIIDRIERSFNYG